MNFKIKRSQNDAKTVSEIDDKSMKIQNLRFLVFREEYNVKIVFYMIRGTRNLSKNYKKNDATSMFEKMVHKSGNMLQKGTQIGAKIKK